MQCSKCNEPIEAHWHFCRWCGTKFDTAISPKIQNRTWMDAGLATLFAASQAQAHSSQQSQGSSGSLTADLAANEAWNRSGAGNW